MAPRERRLSDETALVLELFVKEPDVERYGREIVEIVGLKSGSLYPILRRLEQRGFLESSWEPYADALAAGRRPRRLYRLNLDAADRVHDALTRWQETKRSRVTSSLTPRGAVL